MLKVGNCNNTVLFRTIVVYIGGMYYHVSDLCFLPTLQVCDHSLMFGLEFLQALGFLLFLRQVGGELRNPLLQQLLLLYSQAA